MLLNCTRLAHGCTSLRACQIRRSVTGLNSYGYQLRLLTRRQLDDPHMLLLRRHHFTARQRNTTLRSCNTVQQQQQQLLSIAGARWASRMQSIRRGLGFSKGATHNVRPPVAKMAKSEYMRLLNLAKTEKGVLLAAIACLVVSSGITMSVPFFLGRVIDVVFNKVGLDKEAMMKLRGYSFMLFWVFVLGGLANFARVYLFGTASLRIVRLLRERLFRSMLMQEVGWFDTKGTGELINRLSNDTYHVGISLGQNVSDGLRSVAMIGVGTAMMIYTSPQLALVSALVVPAMAGMGIFYGKYVRRITRAELDKFAEVFKYAEERFGNVKTVKTFSREQQECQAFNQQLDEAIEIGYKETRARSIFFGLTGFSGNFIVISVLYYGGVLVLDNALTIGALSSFMLYAGYVAISMNGLSNFYTGLNRGVGSAERIWEVFDRQCSIPIDQGLVPLQKPIGDVQFQAVDFNFPARADTKVLENFTLTLQPGQTTALVGRSGSGKTTIASLLLRLYDPLAGAILLDNVDLRTLNPQWLRNNVGAVSQEPVLFSGTIRENILYGLNPGDTMDEEHLQKVVQEAHIDEFVNQLPDGLETLVGQRGMMLSGGQKQRVAIARALIKNPTILILDEATSALDAVSEQLVQTALDRLIQGRTVLTIAHRLSTIRNAHKIAVLDGGSIIEEGSYDELMLKSDGAFRELVAKQAFAVPAS